MVEIIPSGNELHQENINAYREFDKTSEGQALLWKKIESYKQGRYLDVASFFLSHPQANRERTIEAHSSIYRSKIPQSHFGRSLKDVSAAFDMTSDQLVNKLHGKKVLNIGIGESTFPDEVQEQDSSIRILSIDNDPEVVKDRKNAMVADAFHLPFNDGEFDEVILSYSLPLWLYNPDQVSFLDEALRVSSKNIDIMPIVGLIDLPPHVIPFKLFDYDRDTLIPNVIEIKFLEKLQSLHNRSDVSIVLGIPYQEAGTNYITDNMVANETPSIAFLTKNNG